MIDFYIGLAAGSLFTGILFLTLDAMRYVYQEQRRTKRGKNKKGHS